MKSKKIKIKNKFKEYSFSRKGGADSVPNPVSNVGVNRNLKVVPSGSNSEIVLSPKLDNKLDNIKKELVQAFNDASPDILRQKLLEQMEKLSGKKLTVKNQTESQDKNKTRKIIPINTELSIFINKLDNSIIYPDQILYVSEYLKSLINKNYSRPTYNAEVFHDTQLRSLTSTVNDIQQGQSSVLFNGYLRRMVAHIEKKIDEYVESKPKKMEKDLKIKINSADSAIQATKTNPNPTTYKYASKAIAAAAKQMQLVLDEHNKTYGGATQSNESMPESTEPRSESIPESTEPRSDSESIPESTEPKPKSSKPISEESKQCIAEVVKTCEDIDSKISQIKGDINPDDETHLNEAIKALEKGKNCIESLGISIKEKQSMTDYVSDSGKSILNTFAQAKGQLSRRAKTNGTKELKQTARSKGFSQIGKMFRRPAGTVEPEGITEPAGTEESKQTARSKRFGFAQIGKMFRRPAGTAGTAGTVEPEEIVAPRQTVIPPLNLTIMPQSNRISSDTKPTAPRGGLKKPLWSNTVGITASDATADHGDPNADHGNANGHQILHNEFPFNELMQKPNAYPTKHTTSNLEQYELQRDKVRRDKFINKPRSRITNNINSVKSQIPLRPSPLDGIPLHNSAIDRQNELVKSRARKFNQTNQDINS